MQLQLSEKPSRLISIWLFLCLLTVASIMLVSESARLMEPGLSIVEWKPLDSLMPPENEEEFQKIFDIYKTFPQFHKSFPNMEIDEFRSIYMLEYVHYLLEYAVIFIFLIPLAILYALKKISVINVIKLCAIFLFGCSGNYFHSSMAQNLLTDEAHLIPYSLSLQITIQFIFFALILWQIFTFSYPRNGIGGFELPKPHMPIKIMACVTMLIILIQISLGGAASGLHAGLSFNTFPLMDGAWSPVGLWPMPEWYQNMFEDAATSQFVHRIMAYSLAFLITLFWISGRNNPHIAHLLPILFSIFVVQFLLGVLTLLFTVPMPLAFLHHANAILLFSVAVAIIHRLFIPIKTMYYDIGPGVI